MAIGRLGTGFGRMGLACAAVSSGFTPANSETTAWVNAVVGDGGTVSLARQQLVDSLISSLKSTSIWTPIDRLWLHAAENSQSALRDIKAAAAAVATGGPTFTANSGYTGTDASSTVRITTDFTPSTAGGAYTQNSAMIGVWNNTNGNSARASISGRVTGVASYNTIASFTDDNAYFRVNTATGASGSNPSDKRGLIMGNRSGANQVDGYKNGASIATNAASASAAVPDKVIVALAGYSNDAAFDGAGIEISATIIGGSLNAAGHLNFYNALRTYMTGVGVP